MYTFSSKLRLFAIISMVLGLVGLVYGFLSVPHTVEEASAVLASTMLTTSLNLLNLTRKLTL